MPVQSSSTRTKLVSVFALLTVLLVALQLVGTQMFHTPMLHEKRVSLDYYIDGQAARPFAYRILIPELLRGIDAVTPKSVGSALDELAIRITNLSTYGGPIRSGPEHRYPRAIVWLAAIQLACLLGYALVGS
jgi:hypothetical protein